jgi:hypothetical protein
MYTYTYIYTLEPNAETPSKATQRLEAIDPMNWEAGEATESKQVFHLHGTV